MNCTLNAVGTLLEILTLPVVLEAYLSIVFFAGASFRWSPHLAGGLGLASNFLLPRSGDANYFGLDCFASGVFSCPLTRNERLFRSDNSTNKNYIIGFVDTEGLKMQKNELGTSGLFENMVNDSNGLKVGIIWKISYCTVFIPRYIHQLKPSFFVCTVQEFLYISTSLENRNRRLQFHLHRPKTHILGRIATHFTWWQSRTKLFSTNWKQFTGVSRNFRLSCFMASAGLSWNNSN